MTRRALTMAAALLGACTMAEEQRPAPAAPEGDACGAAALQTLIGQPSRVLDTMRFAGPVRVLRPGMAVTMDYSAERLNIEVGAAGTITRVACG